jgi:predicted dienelactone hydrolase
LGLPGRDMFEVGFREGRSVDKARSSWAGDGPRPLSWCAWYPATELAFEDTVSFPRQDVVLFVMGKVARDAPLLVGQMKFPLVLLSHGTGGSGAGIGWLGEALASHGFVVIAANHHGNTAVEPYAAEGFLCWWERARDLSVLLDCLSTEGIFAGRIDLDRVFAAGFSLGGYTALALLGAITDMAIFQAWSDEAGRQRGPREFPDLVDQLGPLMDRSAIFRESWARQSKSYRDSRVRAALVCAPAPTVRAFTAESLTTISVPVAIVVGGADREAPAEQCAIWLHERLPNSTLSLLGRDVGHYVFLCEGTEVGRRREPELFVDAAGVDRRAIHEEVIAKAFNLFQV